MTQLSQFVGSELTILTFIILRSTSLGRNIKFYCNSTTICNEMSLRLRVLNLVEIVLRVPPLFVIDEILKLGLGIYGFTEQDFPLIEENYYKNTPQNFTSATQYNPVIYRFVVIALIRFLLSTLGEFEPFSFFLNKVISRLVTSSTLIHSNKFVFGYEIFRILIEFITCLDTSQGFH